MRVVERVVQVNGVTNFDSSTGMKQAGGRLASVIGVNLGLDEPRDIPSGLLWWVLITAFQSVSHTERGICAAI